MANHDDFDRRLRDALTQRERAAAAERDRLARYDAEQLVRDATWEKQSASARAAARREREQTLGAAQQAARLLVHAATNTMLGTSQEQKVGWRRQLTRVPVVVAEGWPIDTKVASEYWVSPYRSDAAERYYRHAGLLLLRDGGLVKFYESEGTQSHVADRAPEPPGSL